MDALLDVLDHFGAHNCFAVHRAKMIGSAPDDLGGAFSLGVPRTTGHDTFILLHRNLLLVGWDETEGAGIGS